MGEQGDTAPHYAARYGKEYVAEILVRKGAKIEMVGSYGFTPLHCAASVGNEPIVRLLLENGADANAHSNAGNTPLHPTAYYGCGVVVKILLDMGADVNHQNQQGCQRFTMQYALMYSRIGHLFQTGWRGSILVDSMDVVTLHLIAQRTNRVRL